MSLITSPESPKPPPLFSFESDEVPIEKVEDGINIKVNSPKLFEDNDIELSEKLNVNTYHPHNAKLKS